jgi:spore germination cell wall hydrolase CwlJ-like protein
MILLQDLLKFFVPSTLLCVIGLLVLSYVPAKDSTRLSLKSEWHRVLRNDARTTVASKLHACRKSKDCRKMAEAVVYESRGESLLGQYSVAWVIKNRMDSSATRDTVWKVVTQAKQFSYLKDMKKQQKPTKEDWTNGYTVSYDVLNGLVDSPVGESTHYHAAQVNPRWAKSLQMIATIDNHLFYE